ncbi:MAG: hypothetical protein ACRD4C_00575 [Candidatus Acidiferrales bacterium]
MSNATTDIFFWVVVRDKKTREVLSSKNFKSHKEAILYDVPPEDRTRGGHDTDVSIEILSAEKVPK